MTGMFDENAGSGTSPDGGKVRRIFMYFHIYSHFFVRLTDRDSEVY